MAQSGPLKQKLESLSELKTCKVAEKDQNAHVLWALVKNRELEEEVEFVMTFNAKHSFTVTSLRWDKLEHLLKKESPVLDVHEEVSYAACVRLNQLFLEVLGKMQTLLATEEF